MQVKTVTLNKSVFADNDAEAERLRCELKEKGLLLVNVMSSPGAGKTSVLSSLIDRLDAKVGVMEADIDGDLDAQAIAKKASRAVQLHTQGMCHVDATMTRQGMDEMGIEGLDLVFLENVGNLVCPAEYDTGAHLDMTILSVPEGDDKPLKYPLIYEKCSLVLINKIDTLSYFDFDLEKCKEHILFRNPNAKIIEVSAKTGEGMDEVAKYFEDLLETFKK